MAQVKLGVALKTLIYVPCSVNASGERKGKPRGIVVYKPPPREPKTYLTDAELKGVWAEDAAQAARPGLAAAARPSVCGSRFDVALANIVSAAGWPDRIAF